MATTTVSQVLKVYSFRLKMNRDGITKWLPGMRTTVENFVEKLERLPPNEEVELDVDVNRKPIARFVRNATGEVLAEFSLPPDPLTVD